MQHSDDIILVRNPHVGCAHFEEEEGYSHADKYLVRYNNVPFAVDAGSVKRFPRYLAEHFAKHLIDHILQQQEDEGKGMMLIRNERKREELKKEIFADVEQTFEEDTRTPAEVDAQKIDALNQDFLRRAKEAVPSTPVNAAEESELLTSEDADIPPPPTDYATWTQSDLLREAKERGITLKFGEKKVDVIAKLVAFDTAA